MEYQLSQHSLQDLVVTKLDVESSVVNVVVDPGHHLLLLLHHGGKLAEESGSGVCPSSEMVRSISAYDMDERSLR